MSYLGKPFEYDFFVSYGRAKRKRTRKSPLRDWSVKLAQELREHLPARWRFREIEVYIDEYDVDRWEHLREQILRAAASSAVLVTIVTDDYLRSEWCKAELEEWDKHQGSGGQVTRGRIAVIHAEDTIQSSWYDRLKDETGYGIPGFRFYPEEDPIALPFGYPKPDSGEPGEFQDAFLDLLRDLLGRVSRLKEEIEERNKAQEQAAKLVAPTPPFYLHGCAGQNGVWNTVAGELRAAGFEVVSEGVDPVHKTPAEEQKFSDERADILHRCAALLVMSTNADPAFDADLINVVRHVRRCLHSNGHALLPCVFFNAVPREELSENRLALEKEPGLKWIDGTQDRWIPELREWLSALRPRSAEAPP
jgi:hypothetical protein